MVYLTLYIVTTLRRKLSFKSGQKKWKQIPLISFIITQVHDPIYN